MESVVLLGQPISKDTEAILGAACQEIYTLLSQGSAHHASRSRAYESPARAPGEQLPPFARRVPRRGGTREADSELGGSGGFVAAGI